MTESTIETIMTKFSYSLQREQQLPAMPFWYCSPLVHWSSRSGLRQIHNAESFHVPVRGGTRTFQLNWECTLFIEASFSQLKDSWSIQMSMWKFLSLPALLSLWELTAPYAPYDDEKMRVRFFVLLVFSLSLSLSLLATLTAFFDSPRRKCSSWLYHRLNI